MAYQTGTSTGCNDLLDKFRLFAIAQGWTVNRWVASALGQELCISKGSAYFNFRSVQNENLLLNGVLGGAGMYGIMVSGSDGYSTGLTWDRQPGYPVRNVGTLGASDQGHVWMMVHDLAIGPFPSYHFISSGTGSLYCELEVSTGIFQRFGVGSLDLYNPAASGGGRFYYATGGAMPLTFANQKWREYDIDNPTYCMECVPFRRASLAGYHSGTYQAGRTTSGSMVRTAFSSFDNWAGSGRDATQQPYPWVSQGGGCHDRFIRDLSPSPLNGIGVLVPNVVSLNINNEFLAPIGQVPGMRYMDMTGYLPGDEFTLGGDTWKVFPWYQKGGFSFQRGIAFLKE